MTIPTDSRESTPLGWSDTDWLAYLQTKDPIAWACLDTLYGTSPQGYLRICKPTDGNAFPLYRHPAQPVAPPRRDRRARMGHTQVDENAKLHRKEVDDMAEMHERIDILEYLSDSELRTLANTATPMPMSGIWVLTAPDGQTWTGESPLRAVSAEVNSRVPPQVALARIRISLMHDDVTRK